MGARVPGSGSLHLEPGRLREGQPVGLGAGQGLLVGVDAPLAEGLEPHPGQEPAPGVGAALDGEGLVVDVQGDLVVGPQGLSRSWCIAALDNGTQPAAVKALIRLCVERLPRLLTA